MVRPHPASGQHDPDVTGRGHVTSHACSLGVGSKGG